MRARTTSALIAASAVVVGNGLAGLTTAQNSPCLEDPPSLTEETSATVDVSPWPLGVRCVYRPEGGGTIIGDHVPSVLVTLLLTGIVAAAWLAALHEPRVRRTGRGLLGASLMLGLLGLAYPVGELGFAGMFSLWFGTPLVFASEWFLRPVEERLAGTMLPATFLVAGGALCGWTFFLFLNQPGLAVAGGLLAGTLASVVAAPVERFTQRVLGPG